MRIFALLVSFLPCLSVMAANFPSVNVRDNINSGGYVNAIGFSSTNLVVNVCAPPFNADSTGATDSTLAISNALASALSVYLPKGVYKNTATLNLRSNQRLFGDGIGQSIITNTGTHTTLMVDSVEKINVSGITFAGTTPSAAQIMIRVESSEQLTWSDLEITGSGHMGIYHRASTGVNIDRLWVHDNGTNASFSAGIYMAGSTNVFIRGCTVTTNGSFGIVIGANSGAWTSQFIVDGNHVIDNGNGGLTVNYGNRGKVVNNLFLSNGSVISGTHDGVNGHHLNEVVFGFNNCISNAYNGISIGGSGAPDHNDCTNNIVIGNVIVGNARNGIYLFQGHNNQLVNNRIIGQGYNGMYLYNATSNTITGNVVLDSGTGPISNTGDVYIDEASFANYFADNTVGNEARTATRGFIAVDGTNNIIGYIVRTHGYPGTLDRFSTTNKWSDPNATFTTANLPLLGVTNSSVIATDTLTPFGVGARVIWDGSVWRTHERIAATTSMPTFMFGTLAVGYRGNTPRSDVSFNPTPITSTFNSPRLTASSGTGATYSFLTLNSTHGLFQGLAAGTTATGVTRAYGATHPALATGDTYGSGGVYYVSAVPDGTDNYWATVGIESGILATYPVNGAFFLFDSFNANSHGQAYTNNWICVTGNGSSYSYADSGVTVSTTPVKLAVICTTTSALFFTNGVQCASITTTLPDSVMVPTKAIMQKTLGSNSRTLAEANTWSHMRRASDRAY